MTTEEREILATCIVSLNSISTTHIYKISQDQIQMKAKSGDNDWSAISIEDAMRDLRDCILMTKQNIPKAESAFTTYQELQIKKHYNLMCLEPEVEVINKPQKIEILECEYDCKKGEA